MTQHQQITRSEFVWLLHQAIRNEHYEDDGDCAVCEPLAWPCPTIELLNAYTRVDLSPFYRTASAASADHRERYAAYAKQLAKRADSEQDTTA